MCARSLHQMSVELHPVVQGSHVELAHEESVCPNVTFRILAGSAKVQTRTAGERLNMSKFA